MNGLNLFFPLPETTEKIEKIIIPQELTNEFHENDIFLDSSCQQLLPDQQLMLKTDASLRVAGYAVLMEIDPNQKFTSKCIAYNPVEYASKTYTPFQSKLIFTPRKFRLFR